jgi:hypothetical protein
LGRTNWALRPAALAACFGGAIWFLWTFAKSQKTRFFDFFAFFNFLKIFCKKNFQKKFFKKYFFISRKNFL